MDNSCFPIAVCRLSSMGVSSHDGCRILVPIQCTGEHSVFGDMLKGKTIIKIGVNPEEMFLSSNENGLVEKLYPSIYADQSGQYGIFRSAISTCIYLFKITSSAEVYLIQIHDSIHYERYYLELLILGCFNEPLHRMAL